MPGTPTLTEFVLSHLPPRPARVLEVGCGAGELARDLAAAGYDVTAIDPNAPEGAIFRRIRLEEVEEDARFDAVIGARSFHHMGPDLANNLDRVIKIVDGGTFVLDEFGYERLDSAASDWYERQRRALRAAGREPKGPEPATWREHHEGHGVTPSDELLAAVRARFEELHYEDVPYLFRFLDGVSSPALEESLIAAGAIPAIGFRFVGIPKQTAPL